MAEPKCPKCDEEGLGNFLSAPHAETFETSARTVYTDFFTIYCDVCSYVIWSGSTNQTNFQAVREKGGKE